MEGIELNIEEVISRIAAVVGCGPYYGVENCVVYQNLYTLNILDKLKHVEESISEESTERLAAGIIKFLVLIKSLISWRKDDNVESQGLNLKELKNFLASVEDAEQNATLTTEKLNLWDVIMQLNHEACLQTEKCLWDRSEVTEAKRESAIPFKELYFSQLTNAFAQSLDVIRTEKSFDDSRITSLIDALESGADIWCDSAEHQLLW